MANVTFLPAAEAEALSALAWYQGQSARAAAGFQRALNDAVRRVGSSPDLYGLIDDRHRQCPLRRYPYSLIYRVDPTGVLVVAVPHSRRRSFYWRRRSP